MTVTIGELSHRYQQLYAFNDDYIRHDFFHVITGFGPTLTDELRVDAYVWAVSPDDRENEGVIESVRGVDLFLRRLYTPGIRGTFWNIVSYNPFDPSQYDLTEIKTISLASEAISDAEIIEHEKLAFTIREDFKKITGHEYGELEAQDIAQLDFSKLNFVSKAQAIKQKHMTPNNAWVEKQLAAAFYKEACKIGLSDKMPAAGSPWHGDGFISHATALNQAFASSKPAHGHQF